MYRHDDIIIDTDDLAFEFLTASPTEVSACEMELESAIADGDGSGVTVHVEGARVWLMCDQNDDAALDEAVEIFGNYVTEHFGQAVLDAALESAGKPFS